MRNWMLFFWVFFQFCFAQQVKPAKEIEKKNTVRTIRNSFTPPKGYFWENEIPGSFGFFLINFKLLPPDSPVLDFRGKPIAKQNLHDAVLDIDIGTKDLQQCADAWIRLYSEYLFRQKRFDEIGFEFTSGDFLSWNDYKNGMRAFVKNGEHVTFKKTAQPNDSYQNFRNYLDLIFLYAGTISLDRESEEITKNENIKVGDFLIIPGSPGHSVIIVGIAKNASGKRLYLLAESFMPAQSVHILKNPFKTSISPWYELDVNSAFTNTAKYTFKPTKVKRFKPRLKKQ